MFKNEYQGGVSLELFSAQGKDSLSKCLTSGPVQKEFDKTIKSFVITLEGETTTTKIALPRDEKQSLYVIQKYLILQLFCPLGQSFSLDIAVLDTNGQKRRILMSTSYREISVTAFHVKVPLSILQRGAWLNLCLDLPSFVSESFKGHSFHALESVTVCANCRLRRIFSMRGQPLDTTVALYNIKDSENSEIESIPKSHQFVVSGNEIQQFTQVLNVAKLIAANISFRVGSGVSSRDASGAKSDDKPTHIAFGSRIVVPKHAKKTSKPAGDSLNRSHSESDISGKLSLSLSSSSSSKIDSSQMDVSQNEEKAPQIEVQKPTIQPRPPKPGSGRAYRRPYPRVRSSEAAKLRERNNNKNKESKDVNHEMNSKDLSSSRRDTKGAINRDSETAPGPEKLDDDFDDNVFKEQNSNHVIHSDNNNNEITNSSKVDSDKQKNSNYENSNGREINNNDVSDSLDTSLQDSGFSSTTQMNGTSEKILGKVVTRLSGIKMGNEDDVEDYLRTRKESESQDEQSISKDNSFSSSTTSESFFLYLSRPRSVSKQSKSRRNSENTSLRTRNNPVVTVERSKTNASLESDFHRDSSDSETDDPLTKFRKSGNSQRSSPRNSPLPPMKSDDGLRQSIKSTLLREIPAPQQNGYNRLKYQSTQSTHSDTMSWMYDSDSSPAVSRTFNSTGDSPGLNDSMNSIGDLDNSPNKNVRRDLFGGLREGQELGSDSEDILSDASDETSYSVWKAPPAHIRNYRYQDEMNGLGMTLDLTATLPLTPLIEEHSSPTKDRYRSASTLPEEESPEGSKTSDVLEVDSQQDSSDVLDLLYDPVLNCYFDPKSHKYYELA